MPKLGSIYLSDWGYVRVVHVTDEWAFVHRCTLSGHRVGTQPSVQTNLAWFNDWPLVIEDDKYAKAMH